MNKAKTPTTKPLSAIEIIRGSNAGGNVPSPVQTNTGIISSEFITRSEVFSFLHGYWKPGYLAINTMSVVKDDREKLLTILENFGQPHPMAAIDTYMFTGEDFNCFVDDSANELRTFMYVTGLPEVLSKFSIEAASILTSEDRDGDYPIIIDYYMMDVQKQMKFSTVSKWTSDFDYLNDHLYPKVDVPLMLKAFLESDETILILTGVPGTGKTSLIKHIMVEFAPHSEEGELTCAYVKEEELLHDSQFWNRLTEASYELIIFDDLDDALGSRDTNEKNNFVNNLLSHSNGVFDNKSKFIITTNKQIEDIDAALIRPGRCFDMLEMPPLSRIEALEVWKKDFELQQVPFDRIFGELEDISQAHLVSEAKRELSDCDKNYLADQSISIRSTFMNKQKRGPGFF